MSAVIDWMGSWFGEVKFPGYGRCAPSGDVATILKAKEKQIAVIFLSQEELGKEIKKLNHVDLAEVEKKKTHFPKEGVMGELECFFSNGGFKNHSPTKWVKKREIPEPPPMPEWGKKKN